jgi:hypothetical protein
LKFDPAFGIGCHRCRASAQRLTNVLIGYVDFSLRGNRAV